MEWCKNYDQPISDLKTQPVKPGEEYVIDVTDIHESGAGIGRTDDGFIIFVDGVLPEARAKVEITKVYNNHAQAEELERLPMEDDEDDEEDEQEAAASEKSGRASRERLGSRDNFWGK